MQLLLVAGLIMLAGALVQGVVGYGLNLLAGPLMALIDPALVPVPLLLVACGNAVMSATRERGHIEWRNVWWALGGRIPGNILGVLAIALLPARGFNLAVGLSVLVCVGLSLITWTPKLNRHSLVVAGTASGAFGTTSAIGGPPIALLYQNEEGPTVRATLGVYFLLSSVSSLVTLLVVGEVKVEHLWIALLLVPFMAVGFLLSSPLRKFVEGPRLRTGILAVAGLAAVVLVGKSVL
nr:sulfite exporter TauE/SafE family protein [Labedaea rhizosphaerae]